MKVSVGEWLRYKLEQMTHAEEQELEKQRAAIQVRRRDSPRPSRQFAPVMSSTPRTMDERIQEERCMKIMDQGDKIIAEHLRAVDEEIEKLTRRMQRSSQKLIHRL